MNNRIKLKSPAIKSRMDMETLVRDITGLKLNEKLLSASMDAEIKAVRDCYESRLTTITSVLAEKTAAARAWADANPAEFGRKKSIEFAHGTVGFRTGTPKLKTLAKNKWDVVLASLRSCRWGAAYLRVKEEINKEQIIADIGARILSETDLRKVGAEVVREESFFVEPKLTRVELRETAQVA